MRASTASPGPIRPAARAPCGVPFRVRTSSASAPRCSALHRSRLDLLFRLAVARVVIAERAKHGAARGERAKQNEEVEGVEAPPDERCAEDSRRYRMLERRL